MEVMMVAIGEVMTAGVVITGATMEEGSVVVMTEEGSVVAMMAGAMAVAMAVATGEEIELIYFRNNCKEFEPLYSISWAVCTRVSEGMHDLIFQQPFIEPWISLIPDHSYMCAD